jgi:hypothetical protein
MGGDVRDPTPGDHRGHPARLTIVVCFLVFGRTGYAEPLHQLGVLEAEGARAEQDSVERYGREWVELSLVPERDVLWILRERPEDGDDRSET